MSLQVHILGECLDMNAWRKRQAGYKVGEIFCLGIIVNDKVLDDYMFRNFDPKAREERLQLNEEYLKGIIKYLEGPFPIELDETSLAVIREALRWLEDENKLESRSIYYAWA